MDAKRVWFAGPMHVGALQTDLYHGFSEQVLPVSMGHQLSPVSAQSCKPPAMLIYMLKFAIPHCTDSLFDVISELD